MLRGWMARRWHSRYLESTRYNTSGTPSARVTTNALFSGGKQVFHSRSEPQVWIAGHHSEPTGNAKFSKSSPPNVCFYKLALGLFLTYPRVWCISRLLELPWKQQSSQCNPWPSQVPPGSCFHIASSTVPWNVPDLAKAWWMIHLCKIIKVCILL